MKTLFGRSKAEKPGPSQLNSPLLAPQPSHPSQRSYEETSFPLRCYHYHVQQREDVLYPAYSQRAGGRAKIIVLPSIDADSICEPHTRMSATTMRAPETVRRPPPLLKDFFDCFVAGTGQDVRTAMTLERNLPPLNPLQYSRLVPPTSLASFARAVGLPNELQLFNKNNVTNEKEAWAVQHPMKLAIRATRQRPPPRPVRRGARVMVRVAGVDHDVGAPLKRPRDTTAVGSSILPGEELQSEEKQRRSKRQKEEEEEERDSAGEDEVESDFMMQDDDDDYDNDLASDGGDGDDFYM